MEYYDTDAKYIHLVFLVEMGDILIKCFAQSEMFMPQLAIRLLHRRILWL